MRRSWRSLNLEERTDHIRSSENEKLDGLLLSNLVNVCIDTLHASNYSKEKLLIYTCRETKSHNTSSDTEEDIEEDTEDDIEEDTEEEHDHSDHDHSDHDHSASSVSHEEFHAQNPNIEEENSQIHDAFHQMENMHSELHQIER